jgi:hypothetical protein
MARWALVAVVVLVAGPARAEPEVSLSGRGLGELWLGDNVSAGILVGFGSRWHDPFEDEAIGPWLGNRLGAELREHIFGRVHGAGVVSGAFGLALVSRAETERWLLPSLLGALTPEVGARLDVEQRTVPYLRFSLPIGRLLDFGEPRNPVYLELDPSLWTVFPPEGPRFAGAIAVGFSLHAGE